MALAEALALECPRQRDGSPARPERAVRLEAAHDWASHWSMGRLSEWYESVYASAMVRPGP